jgi:F0F1-type ATP synthase membrane subunit b/b'
MAMGKDPFEDPELSAMRSSMRPAAGQVRWGRVLTGVLVVACATFAVAYYLPLRRAHETLTLRFAELKSKIDSANHARAESQGRAKELSDKNQTLQSQLDELQQREKAGTEASRAIKSALESKLQKPIAGDQAAVGIAGGQAVASLSLGYLLTRGKLEVSLQGKAALCSVASAASNPALRVVAIAGKKDIPAALAPKLKTPLDYSLAVAQLVTQTLIDQCKAAPAKLSATGVPVESTAGPKLDGKKLSGPRIELWLE